ncbi:MAG: protein-glutamate O-methyltransferase CheR [Colwellia sp.]|nr:protein-glutamate O-methyltransferase CheR [Colwellia sp.]
MKNLHAQKISVKDFKRIASFVYNYSGIKLSEAKQTMVEGRLKKRLKHHEMATYKEYCDFVLSQKGKSEVIYLIDVLTTNKTDFFRELQHFDYLNKSILPLLTQQGIGRHRPLRIWSAGCSSGEEAYTISMVLHQWNESNPPIDFEIIGTDISVSVLKKATKGLYTVSDIEAIPLIMRQKYLLRSEADANVVKIPREIRKNVSFGMLNFRNNIYNIPHQMDIIFCRNVLIYFDKDTQQDIISKFCRLLVPQGYLFLGHSESIKGLSVPLETIGTTTYRKIIDVR